MTINLTLDNVFRHPLRWGSCPVNLSRERIYGLYVRWGEHMPTTFTKRWTVILYYGRRYRAWSNFPLS